MLLTVKPYLMDLETTNGTFLNGDKIEDQRYYEVCVSACRLERVGFRL